MKKWLLYIALTCILLVIGATLMNVYAKSKENELAKTINIKEEINPNNIEETKEEKKEQEEIQSAPTQETKQEEPSHQNEVETSKGYISEDALANTNQDNTVSSTTNPNDLKTTRQARQ